MRTMSATERMSRVAMIPIAPALIVQARRLRRTTLILPEAARPWSGRAESSNDEARPLSLLVLGDSTAAGVGARTQDRALPGNLAHDLAGRLQRPVDWRAFGESGITSRELIARCLDDAIAAPFDFAFLSIGANDALGLRSRGAFARDMRTILTRLRSASPEAVILMSSLPAFFRFELLPDPLRRTLYRHSRSLEAGARAVVRDFDGAHMSPPPPPYTDGFFASDLFHPSESGYRDWAEFAIADAVTSGHLAQSGDGEKTG